jgi:hypothetical protein
MFKKQPAPVAAYEPIVCWALPKLEIKMTTFKFKTREDYVTYREDWKTRYAEQILEIRRSKEAFKQANRAFSISSKGERVWDCKVEGVRGLYDKMEHARWSFRTAKNGATELLFERGESKVEAGRQRELRLKKIA